MNEKHSKYKIEYIWSVHAKFWHPARFSSSPSKAPRRIFIYASSRLLSLRLLLESATKRMITRIVCVSSELLAYPWKDSQGNGAVFPLIPRFFEPRRRAEWLQRDDGLLVPVYGPVECRPVAFSWWTLPISDGLVSGSESIVSRSAFLLAFHRKPAISVYAGCLSTYAVMDRVVHAWK